VSRVARVGRVAPRVRRVLATALAASALAGCLGSCGESVELPDLFVVQRSGGGSGGQLTVVVNEGGAVHCYQSSARRGPSHQLSDPQLVLARGIQEELQSPSAKHLVLPARAGSVFSYYVRDAEGTVRFSDNSAGQPSVLHHLAYFVLEVQQQVCHLAA
jgi:hypothetical protein